MYVYTNVYIYGIVWYGICGMWYTVYLWYVVYCVAVVNAFAVLHGCESNLDLRLVCKEKNTELHSITRKTKIVYFFQKMHLIRVRPCNVGKIVNIASSIFKSKVKLQLS